MRLPDWWRAVYCGGDHPSAEAFSTASRSGLRDCLIGLGRRAAGPKLGSGQSSLSSELQLRIFAMLLNKSSPPSAKEV